MPRRPDEGHPNTRGPGDTAHGSPPDDVLDARELQHEIRTLLAAAVYWAEYLVSKHPDWADDEDQRALELIRTSVRHTLAALHEAVPVPSEGLPTLGPLLREAVRHIPEHRQPDLRVERRAPGSLVLRADRRRVMYVLTNLLDNAARYSPARTPIVLAVRRFGVWALIAVRAHGIGIPPDQIATIFMSHRTAAARAEGSGMSLGLSRALAKADGGHMWVKSRPGGGSTFYLAVPLATRLRTRRRGSTRSP